MTEEVMTFLQEWLTTHILKSDATLGQFISALG
jgi:hemerythrin